MFQNLKLTLSRVIFDNRAGLCNSGKIPCISFLKAKSTPSDRYFPTKDKQPLVLHYIQYEHTSQMYNIQHGLGKNKTGRDEAYGHRTGDAENSPAAIHHSSLEIYISLLWVKKALCIKKFIVPWFAVSINLLGKSHQSVP